MGTAVAETVTVQNLLLGAVIVGNLLMETVIVGNLLVENVIVGNLLVETVVVGNLLVETVIVETEHRNIPFSSIIIVLQASILEKVRLLPNFFFSETNFTQILFISMCRNPKREKNFFIFLADIFTLVFVLSGQ
jgi:hypothetical protein